MFDHIKAMLNGMSYGEYRNARKAKLKLELEVIEGYKPNYLTYIRDTMGFGKFKLSTQYYLVQVLVFAALYVVLKQAGIIKDVWSLIGLTA